MRKELSKLGLEDFVEGCTDSKLKIGKIYHLSSYDPTLSFARIDFGNYAQDPFIRFDVEEHKYGLKIGHIYLNKRPLAFICRGIHFQKSEAPFYIVTIERKNDYNRERLLRELIIRFIPHRMDTEAVQIRELVSSSKKQEEIKTN